MHRIGMLTIGQSPRDDIMSVIEPHLPSDVEVVQRGALDGLDAAAIDDMQPTGGQSTLVSLLRDGSEATMAHEKVVPLMQEKVNELEQEEVELIVLLCAGDFPELRSDRRILHPGTLLRGAVGALADGSRVGVVVPSEAQVAAAKRDTMLQWGASDVFVTHGSPYLSRDASAGEWDRVTRELCENRVDLVYLHCMGMDENMKATVRQATGKPVMLASSVVARLIGELVG